MFKYLEMYEKLIYYILIGLLAVMIGFSVCELVYMLFISIFGDLSFALSNQEMLTLFGYFLLVIIGIELMDSIKAYITQREIHVEIIVLLAIIAVARKVILLDLSDNIQSELIGLGAVVVALSVSYYLIKTAPPYKQR